MENSLVSLSEPVNTYQHRSIYDQAILDRFACTFNHQKSDLEPTKIDHLNTDPASQSPRDSIPIKVEDLSREKIILALGSIGVNLSAYEDIKVNIIHRQKRRTEAALKKVTPPKFVFSVLSGSMVKRCCIDDCPGLRAQHAQLQYLRLSHEEKLKKNPFYREDDVLDWEQFEQAIKERYE